MTRKKTEAEVRPAWFMPDELIRVPVGELVPYARNARTHSEAQIMQLRASLREFGFVNPVLIDGARNIIAGHGRVLAAQAEGMTEVPCVLVEHLSDTQRRAYILADNRLAEMSGWDMELVSLELGELQGADFDLTLIGFDEMDLELEPPEADAQEKKTASAENDDFADEEAEKAPPRCVRGDVWRLGDHVLLCGNCAERETLIRYIDSICKNGGGNS
ncbi:MAG: ParB/Srx family N-terminal domain-containing protein [Clostridiales bacterium]|nr:ParB/Srx family N-terminal domain-containing protein [Clostridiales bacterium]